MGKNVFVPHLSSGFSPFKRFLPDQRRRLTALFFAILSFSPIASADNFFDDIPRKGYLQQDVFLDVLRSSVSSPEVVAQVRFMSLVLDPGRRDLAFDLWPRREMLLVQLASGARIVFEKVIPVRGAGQAVLSRGRFALDGAAPIEVFEGSSPASAACPGVRGVIRAGQSDLPLDFRDLEVPTVRMGIRQFLENGLTPRDQESLSATVQIVMRAGQVRSLPLGPLDVLRILFPEQRFAPSTESLDFRVSVSRPLDPSDGPFRSLTEAPEILQGTPLF